MTPLAEEWILKAEGDFATAGRELRARRAPNLDAACFHAQQAAEKYLKAYLQEHGTTFARTHNLIDLLEQCVPIDPSFGTQRPTLILLDQYAVRYRYPGDTADRLEARAAVRAVIAFRLFTRSRLGLG
jgi:HEPN domain-containing protein